ncbi:MAG: hypothetical protein LBD23_15520 [Oscillospiraceae bacterium]|jgi:hypothetical protein|nr:hypothetical protein [Oscillospiraceae bacterium]
MLTQKQWKTQHLTEHIRNVAISATTEAAHLSAMHRTMVREHAIIAEEIRSISTRILDSLEKNIYCGLSDDDFTKIAINYSNCASYLALNAALLACKVREHKAMAVFAEELRTFSLELGELYGKSQRFIDAPAVLPRSKVIPDIFYIFTAISGKYVWRENAQYVHEVLSYWPDFIKNDRYIENNEVRDRNIPLIKLGELTEESGIVIISDTHDPKKQYAVLAEFTLHSLVNSHVGINKECKTDIPVRECWSASDGNDLIFPDWEKLVIS